MTRSLRTASTGATLATVLACAVLALPTSAIAAQQQSGQQGVAPPGNSGVAQYVEDLPTSKGNKPSNTIHTHHGGSGGGSGTGGSGGGTSGSSGSGGSGSSGSSSAISGSVVKRMQRSGANGKAAAALAVATGEASGVTGGSGTHAATDSVTAAPASEILKTLGGSDSGGGGLGAFFPVILGAALIVISILGVNRRRGRSV